MLPDDPTAGLIAALQDKLGADVHVMGERPADLAERWLPCVVLTRRGGTELASAQAILGDAPLVFADVYTDGLDAGYSLMRDVRAAMYALGARANTGPVPTPDAAEAAGVRRLTASWRYLTH
jgi:hypothetical protein